MKTLHRNLTVQVLIAISLGVLLGLLAPGLARAMKPLGDTFVNLVRMVIAPIIFLTIVLGIANMRDLKKVGRVGGKALLYFEIVTTFALAIGLIVVNVTKPGAGLDVSALAKGDVSKYTDGGKPISFVDFVTHIVPASVVGAFAHGDMLQIVFFSVLFGVALALARRARAAGGARARAAVARVLPHRRDRDERRADRRVRRDGVHRRHVRGVSLLPLARLMLDVYLTMALFIFVGLNLIARVRLLASGSCLSYIRDEILHRARHVVVRGGVAAHARQDGALWLRAIGRRSGHPGGLLVQPRRHVDLPVDGGAVHRAGVRRGPVARPAARCWRADGDVEGRGGRDGLGLHRARQHALRDAGGPVEGVALLLGVDRFMSEARAITNLIGNGGGDAGDREVENAYLPTEELPSEGTAVLGTEYSRHSFFEYRDWHRVPRMRR